ncbi:MAG: MerR family transcriptional regulator [Candidatus Obscuribacterales bacterium]|nr:MerR family transcriptional regulator [Candidatus Obscuribacterales bacterium]
MSRNKQADGTKIAQAAKDLNVTSVTIRRYLTEFNIETMSDENGIKVLPAQAMDELQEVRRLKEDGMTNPKVMEFLEERRTKSGADAKPEKPKARAKAKVVESKPVTSKARKVEEVEEEEDEEEVAPVRKVAAAKPVKKTTARRVAKAEVVEAEEAVAPVAAEVTESGDADDDSESNGDESEAGDDNRSKHSLTCQTCGKVFEHMNPRLRDCLDCYRAKRKERRRGGADRHKNVIQHPLAQQAAAKAPSAQAAELAAAAASAPAPRQRDFSPAASSAPAQAPSRERDRDRDRGADRERNFDRDRGADKGGEREREREFVAAPAPSSAPLVQRGPVRNYRKAIEETRQITGSLKRRLERPDLPEGERRWLEQIYAYQLILHQGWRHLAEYKSAGQNQSGRTED